MRTLLVGHQFELLCLARRGRTGGRAIFDLIHVDDILRALVVTRCCLGVLALVARVVTILSFVGASKRASTRIRSKITTLDSFFSLLNAVRCFVGRRRHERGAPP